MEAVWEFIPYSNQSPTPTNPLRDPLPYGIHSPAATNSLHQRVPCGCQCPRVPPPYGNQSPAACIPVWLLLPYGSQQPRFPLPYGNQCPAASVLLFPDPPAIRPRHSLPHGPCCHRSKQVYGLMPRMGMKAIHALVTRNCGFGKAARRLTTICNCLSIATKSVIGNGNRSTHPPSFEPP